MSLTADDAVTALRAVGEQTRLRIVALLALGELSVSELTEILGQSQPRISRHLKLLVDGGVAERHREGNRVFFSVPRDQPTETITNTILDAIDSSDPLIHSDRERFDLVRRRRAAAAAEYFSTVVDQWDQVRSRHIDEQEVEAAIVDSATRQPFESLLDVGTGTGRMLELLAPYLTDGGRIAGLDTSQRMLAVARSNLDAAGIGGVELRQGDLASAPFAPRSFDLVVVHQLLHFLDDTATAVTDAASLVAPGGRLLIVDFAPHQLDFLQREYAHRRLGFDSEVMHRWITGAGLSTPSTLQFPPTTPSADTLTVSMWVAGRPEDQS